MQVDNVTEKRFRGSLHCARTLVKENGVKILYTGYVVNTIREITFLSVYFGVYEHCKMWFTEFFQTAGEKKSTSSVMAVPLAGGCSGYLSSIWLPYFLHKDINSACAWFVSFPLDSIKANIQGRPASVITHEKRRIFQVARDIFRKRGIMGLYSGVGKTVLFFYCDWLSICKGPSVFRAFIVSSTRFSAYEAASYLFTKMDTWRTSRWKQSSFAKTKS